MSTTTEELNRFCKLIPGFVGTHPSDDLPRFAIESYWYGLGFIANYSKENEDGTHWIAMFFKHGVCHYFDSFGLEPDEGNLILFGKNKKRYAHFREYINRHAMSTVYNKIDLQDIHDDECGEYCGFFIKYGPVDKKNPFWAGVLSIEKGRVRDEYVKRMFKAGP